jgi:glycosyltransferase involved in cell wall biosynthesis
VVICTRNRAAQIDESLHRICALTCQEPWELIVVDNGSVDDTRATIERHVRACQGNLSIVEEPIPGTGRAKNRGWRVARGDVIVFTDDDCYPDARFLEQYLQCFEEDGRLGFVGGRVLLHDPADYPITIKESEQRQDIPPYSFIPAGLIHGANLACRREALDGIGGFDEMFGAGAPFSCEDVDVMARISFTGWHGAYDPRPLVFHHHRRKSAEAARLMKQYDRGRGAYFAKSVLNTRQRPQYLRRWYWRSRSQPWRITFREMAAAAEYFMRLGLSSRSKQNTRDLSALA